MNKVVNNPLTGIFSRSKDMVGILMRGKTLSEFVALVTPSVNEMP